MRLHNYWPVSLLICSLIVSCATLSTTPLSTPMQEEKTTSPHRDELIESILRSYPQYFDSLLKNNQQWRIQIIYTQIDRGANNMPKLTHHYFNLHPENYFYPASTVKMPAAILALQKLNELKIRGLDKNNTMITDASPGQTAVYNDPTAPDGRPTIANYIKKIFLVSDNDANNRLYEFLGQEYLNNSLHKLGYDSVQLFHRLQMSLTEEQNRTTNAISFYDAASKPLYKQPMVRSNLVYQPRKTLMGKGYKDGDKIVNQPFDFSKKNRISLADLNSILQSVIFPESVPAKKRFNLSADDYPFLYKYMSMKPSESLWPKYDTSYTDAYGKFLLFGGAGPIQNPGLRIFNKIGDAYGFLNDVAYIVDFNKGVEFMLSATIYCNSDGIFNDDKYDYDAVGYPFMRHLGEAIYNYESRRLKKNQPDLSKFKLDYTR